MKKILLFLLIVSGITATAQVKVGDNPTTIGTSSLLELESANKALVLTRVANTGMVTNPVIGMIVYDMSSNCVKAYQGGGWTGCLFTPPVASMTFTGSITYNGPSPIGGQGVGYNGEAVVPTSTISLGVNVTTPGSYSVSGAHAGTGLVYSASGTITSPGVTSITLVPNGVTIPATTIGVLPITVSGTPGSLLINPRIDVKSAATTVINDVTFGSQTWMDRNLGASRVATSTTDVLSYGSFYQWGRPSDGHEIMVWKGDDFNTSMGLHGNSVLNAYATSDAPSDPKFIITNSSTGDWRSDNNNNRWNTASQGPCPTNYHVPTYLEWEAAVATGSWTTQAAMFASPLKIPVAGLRDRQSGAHIEQGNYTFLWTSQVGGTGFTTKSRVLEGNNGQSFITAKVRANGFSVRCIKN